jgi:hypothetical protein
MALLVVLAVTVTLSALALLFHDTSANRLALAKNFQNRTKALNLARAGVVMAEEVLRMDTRPYYAGVVDGERADASEDPTWSKVDELYRLLHASTVTPMRFGDGMISVRIEDEDSRLCLNRTDAYSRQFLYNLLETLKVRKKKRLEIVGETVEENRNAEMAAAVADWIDRDSAITPGGAEDAEYAKLEPPYAPRNAFLPCLEELALVRDFDAEVLFGRPGSTPAADGADAPLPEPLEAEAADATTTGTGSGGLLRHLTLFGSSYRVNFNTASDTVLGSVPGLFASQGGAVFLEALRRARPFRSLPALVQAASQADPEAWRQMQLYCKISSEYYRIRATGFSGRSTATVEAILKKVGERTLLLRWRQL